MFRFMLATIGTARAGTSGENLFVVLLVIDPASHEWGSPVNPMRFTILLRIRNPHSESAREIVLDAE
ncbi:hypothetical protein BA060_06200 [Brucella sp. B13-0095]|nr:hypothetical protein BKD03_12095 [Brucella sp. 09RB8471]OEI84051.1 hypothetical protein BA060_06200 [Brucella sp. B13-0095]